MTHLFLAISAHGHGHLAQASLLIDEIHRRHPDLRLTLQTDLPRKVIRRRVRAAFDLIPEAPDVGMVMNGPLDVLVEPSYEAYVAFHDRWPEFLEREKRYLETTTPDLVLSDVAYLPLAAARSLGIRAAALCSLNWADVLASYCGHLPETERLRHEILDAYRQAAVFLQPQPSMPMPDLDNTCAIGPLAQRGQSRRQDILVRLHLAPHTRLILCSLGGVTADIPFSKWPPIPDTHWLVQSDQNLARPDMTRLKDLDLPFLDLLCSADAVLTKPGYGIFTEAVCNGIPVIYVPRGDWPEEPYLLDWLHRHQRALGLTRQRLHDGAFDTALNELLATQSVAALSPIGIEQAANILDALRSGQAFHP